MTVFKKTKAGHIGRIFKSPISAHFAAVFGSFAIFTLVPLQAHADFFKCKDANGKFSYQQVPCEKNADQQQMRQGPRRLITVGGDKKTKSEAEQRQ